MRWEYTQLSASSDEIVEKLNELGRNGWEVVGVTRMAHETFRFATLLLKRALYTERRESRREGIDEAALLNLLQVEGYAVGWNAREHWCTWTTPGSTGLSTVLGFLLRPDGQMVYSPEGKELGRASSLSEVLVLLQVHVGTPRRTKES